VVSVQFTASIQYIPFHSIHSLVGKLRHGKEANVVHNIHTDLNVRRNRKLGLQYRISQCVCRRHDFGEAGAASRSSYCGADAGESKQSGDDNDDGNDDDDNRSNAVMEMLILILSGLWREMMYSHSTRTPIYSTEEYYGVSSYHLDVNE
jgi:hypothetical protein